MKTFRRSIAVFLLFMVGTMAVIHIDRQCAAIEKRQTTLAENLTEKLENFIEKQRNLL